MAVWRAKEGGGRLSGCVGMLCYAWEEKGEVAVLWRKMGSAAGLLLLLCVGLENVGCCCSACGDESG